MQTAQFIVWEPTFQWTVHFRRLLSVHGVRICSCRTQQACDEMLTKWPTSVVAVAVSVENFGEQIGWLSSISRRFPQVRCVALVSEHLRNFETTIYESGAVSVVFSPSQLRPITEMVKCHLAQTPVLKTTPRQRILASLPWGD